ncbi:unnamed protein product, partial [marine sediment metagenome]
MRINDPKIKANIISLFNTRELLGFDSIHVNDHFLGMDARQDRKEPMLDAMMLLTALAVETKNVKLGQIVLCNSFRNPAYLS